MLDGGARGAGVVECVGIAIMVGLAVDYVVHMATCVAHCPAHGRDGVTFALRTMAMSVMSGAVTTIGAALFLLPCEMAAFQQFGALPLCCRGMPSRSVSIRCVCASDTAPGCTWQAPGSPRQTAGTSLITVASEPATHCS